MIWTGRQYQQLVVLPNQLKLFQMPLFYRSISLQIQPLWSCEARPQPLHGPPQYRRHTLDHKPLLPFRTAMLAPHDQRHSHALRLRPRPYLWPAIHRRQQGPLDAVGVRPMLMHPRRQCLLDPHR